MTEADGAWMARILARFDDELVAAAVSVGKYDPASEEYLTQTLIERRDAILRRYLNRLSPITDVQETADGFCATDRARESGIVPNEKVSFRARLYRAEELAPGSGLTLDSSESPRVCVSIPHLQDEVGLAPDDPARYVLVDLDNGYAEAPLRVHLYDLGAAGGFRLAGIERPESSDRP
jgi:hypothetical protein